MTRRGGVAYYLCAWVVGCFFFALARLLTGAAPAVSGGWSRIFFSAYFITLAYGWLVMLGFAFLLRRIASALGWQSGAAWAMLGAALSLLLYLAAALLGSDRTAQARWLPLLRELFEMPPYNGVPLKLGWRTAPLAVLVAGALTSVLLNRVHRAFEPRGEETPAAGLH